MEIIKDITEQCCSKCREVKPISDFRKCKSNKSGFMSYCILCHNADSKERYEKNKELRLAQVEVWNEQNCHKTAKYNDKWRKKQKKETRKLKSELKNHVENLNPEIIERIEDGQNPNF